jgi:hypothetical protein
MLHVDLSLFATAIHVHSVTVWRASRKSTLDWGSVSEQEDVLETHH